MSRIVVSLIALLGIFFGSSCVPSVHGIATESNSIFDPLLVNSWVSEDGESAWVFESMDDMGYELTVSSPEGPDGSFYAAVVELEGELFLDLFPSDQDPNWPMTSFYGLHFLPIHTFMHMELGEDSLSLRMMDPSWLDAWLKQNPEGIGHERENFAVLTASTAELQAWLPTLLAEEPISGGGFMGGDASPFTDALVLMPGELEVADGDMTDTELDEELQELMPDSAGSGQGG